MNWRRGLFRLWVSLSVPWIVGIPLAMGIVETWNRPAEIRHGNSSIELPPRTTKAEAQAALEAFIIHRKSDDNPGPFRDLIPDPKVAAANLTKDYDERANHRAVLEIMYLALGPPVAAFAIGVALLWVARGFRPGQ